jgi:outer membrane receptor protein involved in Fe transport
MRTSFSKLLFSIVSSLPFFAPAQTPEATVTPEIVVTGKAEDLLGTASSASRGQASAAEIANRPYLRRGEILETIPGVIITQHAGGGKANQYFLRGFNLDHGTDFATSVDGMPMNLRTHAHGQGYTDLNPLIPELIERVDYVKGTYTAANGDLSTAGSADFRLFHTLPRDFVTFEIGEDNYYRGLIAGTLRFDVEAAAPPVVGAKNPAGKNPGKNPVASVMGGEINALTYALEYNSYEGPFELSEDFARWNGLLRWFKGDEDNYFSATLMGYKADWASSEQIAQRAVSRADWLPYLLGYNAGIESGQLVVVICAFLALAPLWSRPWYRRRVLLPVCCVIALVGLGMAWSRIVA